MDRGWTWCKQGRLRTSSPPFTCSKQIVHVSSSSEAFTHPSVFLDSCFDSLQNKEILKSKCDSTNKQYIINYVITFWIINTSAGLEEDDGCCNDEPALRQTNHVKPVPWFQGIRNELLHDFSAEPTTRTKQR